jgi:very-short-patch-repair endonuclease
VNQFSTLINERIEAMRRKLQDTSRRNPLINNVLNAKSASFIRIVDEKPQSIFDHIVIHDQKMVLFPLPPVDMDPPDEDTSEFKNAFQNAQLTDETYLKIIDKIDFEYDERWLEFSATKRLGEVAHNHDRVGHTDSPFEDHVIEAVRSLGYIAVPQVGVSSYFIDIGVKHSTYPLGYICGIECDGATYHSSKSARDRDRLREEVLNRLGWDLYRIWSTDWFRDPLGCREVLKIYLTELLAKLVKSMPEIVEPKKADVVQKRPEPRFNIKNDDVREEIRIVAPVSKTVSTGVKIGSKLSIRYLDGPRAGTVAKFWLQKTTNDPKFESDGYTSVGANKPLGEALEGGMVDDIVTYTAGSQEIRVQIIDLLPLNFDSSS